ncbi:unnamed protein product [Pedinophyceae sp. YPF-701]|nr:unnamed protein product [Pedinophyceae sp. YPF-701]
MSSASSDDIVPVVIDNGSTHVRAGFAGYRAPEVCVRTQLHARGAEQLAGGAALEMDGFEVKYPMSRGEVTDWDAMEAVWRHVLEEELKVSPLEHPILVTDAPLTSKAAREKALHILMESLDVPAAYMSSRAELTVYGAQGDTGLAVHVGGESTFTCPVYGGYLLPHAFQRLPLGFKDVTRLLGDALGRRDVDVKGEQLRELAESCVCAGPQGELHDAHGGAVTVGPERYECMECLFDPSRAGAQFPSTGGGIVDMAVKSVMAIDQDCRQEIVDCVVLGGAAVQVPGFAQRVQSELESRLGPRLAPKVVLEDAPGDLAFRGAARITANENFAPMWISKEEYDEYGPGIVHRKCF